MKVAAGQFAVTSDSVKNVGICIDYMRQAQAAGVDLLVLPEALLARDDNDPDMSVNSAQASLGSEMTTFLTIHVPTTAGRAANTQVALRNGEIVAVYQKIHLYDAFSMQESRLVDAGATVGPLVEVAGMKVGMMTCYDLRFPEMAISLALAGAEVLVLPTAWVRGSLKEHHWSTLLAARALDSTCYVVAAGECGNKNIGQSRVIDPLGVTIAAAAESPALIVTDVTAERLTEARNKLPVLKHRRFAPPTLL
jgi:deaminated glutathione amidase